MRLQWFLFFVGEEVGCVEHGDAEFGGERACVCGTLVVLEEFVVGEAGAFIIKILFSPT